MIQRPTHFALSFFCRLGLRAPAAILLTTAMLTTAQFILLMEHALGKTPDSRHSLIATFNRAGRALFTASDWSFRLKEATVEAVAAQEYFDLPADFGCMRNAYINAATGPTGFSRIRPCTKDEIVALRQAGEGDGSGNAGGEIWVAFPEYTSSTTDTTQPTPIAACWPTPEDNEEPTFTLDYLARWRTCDASSNEVPNIPDEWEEALRLCAIYFALTTENPTGDYSNIKAQYEAEISRLMVEEARNQRQGALRTGGASARSNSLEGQRHVLAFPINL